MNAGALSPIDLDDRVSDVLARDEALVEVFARRSPHFAKLRNRSLRRVMARLVTVAQAARIAGVPAQELVGDLNAALGIAAGAASRGSPLAPERATDVPFGDEVVTSQRPGDAREVELDVRDDLRTGREPFSRIMAAVSSLRPDEVLRLRTTFEPLPLLAVMARRGFAHETRSEDSGDWSVWFWRAEPEGAPTEGPSAAANLSSVEYLPAPNEQLLDVRHLEPPEPMLRTLAALESLPAETVLVQLNRRVPQFLLPILAERGFACTVDESQPERVLVRIWRPT